MVLIIAVVVIMVMMEADVVVFRPFTEAPWRC
jgi:hypothetical protein